MNNEGVGTRFSLNQEESYLCEYKSSGNVHYPMWHGKGERETHVAELKQIWILGGIGISQKGKVKVSAKIKGWNYIKWSQSKLKQ